ncbi:uncharacterized protein DS421_5g159570 [Arachis hypogaea]|nr:uncharacterized protein DS421_5g159570 [Arachis hypogaea]
MLMPSEFRLFFIILCYVGTNVLRKETGHSNSGLLWGINNQAFNIAPFYYKEKWNIYYETF